MARNIAAVLGDPAIDVDSAKVTNLLMRRNEVLLKEFAYFGI